MNKKEEKFYLDLLEDTRNIYKDWVDALQEKVKQLETNRDEAIEILKLCNSQCSKEAISKLERSKDRVLYESIAMKQHQTAKRCGLSVNTDIMVNIGGQNESNSEI